MECAFFEISIWKIILWLITIKEKFIPVQIDQELCMKCERCVNACRQEAIYFEDGIRLVDYFKCKGCLACVQVCPRNAIEVTSVTSEKVLTIKIEHEKCNMCLRCINEDGTFCPNDLYYLGKVKDKDGKEIDGIRFKFSEVDKCQGCLKCELSCPQDAIKIVKFENQP
ncbi:MAG: 4Fe-4S binding protein [Promethearchaeati archaeon]